VGQARALLPLTVADQLSNEITRIYIHSFFATTLLLEHLSSCPIISVLPWPCVHPPSRDRQSYEYREETHLCSITPVTEYSTPDLSYQRFTFRPPLLSSPHHLCRFSSSPSHSHPSTAESGATGPYASICTPQTPGGVPNGHGPASTLPSGPTVLSYSSQAQPQVQLQQPQFDSYQHSTQTLPT